MKKPFNIQDRQTAFHYLKKDFMSAYNNNGNNIELALLQVAHLRDVHESYVRSILFDFIQDLTKYNECDASEIDLY
jgi:hypothetical protein